MDIAVPTIGILRRGDVLARHDRMRPLRGPATDLDASVGEVGGDARRSRPAAVLIGLVERDDGSHVVLTRRTGTLRTHAGQVALPGGQVDPGDGSPVDTALREAEEEIGLPRSAVEAIGRLPPYATRSGFLVHPVIGLIDGHPPFVANSAEVADIFEVPLAYAVNPANLRRDSRLVDGERRFFWTMGEGERRIWGVTAGILHLFYEEVFR